MRGVGDIERLDTALASLAREETALRLRLGQLLEALGRGAVFELGFSSLGAYAVERCERSVRWAEGARCLARRLEALPALRRAMAIGKVSWSMGELLARVATPASEVRWLELAESRTVRQVRVLVAEAMAEARAAGAGRALTVAASQSEPAPARDVGPEEDESLGTLQSSGDDICILTCTVDREDAWLFEATRCLLEQLGSPAAGDQAEALLAEGQSALLAALPPDAIDWDGLHDHAVKQRLEELRRWRDRAEASCERNVLAALLAARTAGAGPAAQPLPVGLAAAVGIGPLEQASCTALDQQVRAVAAALARHELELSTLALRFHRGNGWRKLGYATETQYARERLGLSRSSLHARRTLALRLETLPGVAAALGAAQIGVEAALQLVRIATPKTEAAWLERARQRTIKHLREEVAAALTAVRVAGERDCLPPEDAELAAFQSLEQAVVSGAVGQAPASGGQGARPFATSGGLHDFSKLRDFSEPASEARRAWWKMLGSLAAWLEGALQMSAVGLSAPAARAHASAGRVTLRLRMTRETYVWWRALEAQARPWLPAGVSWLRFLCASVWLAWRHLIGSDVAYGEAYIRDRFRCTNPVCHRRDVTPHHIVFRSAGGSDALSNITSPCVWCHLHGIHGGRIRVFGTAERLRWELGPKHAPCVIVHGRERMAA